MTVYVERLNGIVVGVYANLQAGRAEEELGDDHADVLAFRSPPPSISDIVRERERRLALGFDYDFGDVRGTHHIGTTEGDMKGWDEVAKGSLAFIAIGQPSTQIAIVTNTGPAIVTALEFQQILAAATAARQPLWTASFILQSMSPIPNDYEDDTYWE